MKIHTVLALTLAVCFVAATAQAQRGVARGKVVDENGQAVEAATVTSSAFRASMYPGRNRGMLSVPAALATSVGDDLAKMGHRIEIVTMQQPYRQPPTGAGAVKMVRIDPETGVFFGGVSPAKSDYVMGW